MKTSLVAFILFFMMSNVYSQSTNAKIDTEDIKGLWFLPYHAKPPKELVFEKAKDNEIRWGDYIALLDNGELVVGHSAPCGNDPNRFRNSGTWKFDTRKNKITFSIDMHGKGKNFIVKLVTKDKMFLE